MSGPVRNTEPRRHYMFIEYETIPYYRLKNQLFFPAMPGRSQTQLGPRQNMAPSHPRPSAPDCLCAFTIYVWIRRQFVKGFFWCSNSSRWQDTRSLVSYQERPCMLGAYVSLTESPGISVFVMNLPKLYHRRIPT